jgi:hypothetical protein
MKQSSDGMGWLASVRARNDGAANVQFDSPPAKVGRSSGLKP